MSLGEIPFDLQCAGNQLFGVLHLPSVPNRRGVVILTGWNRCGPHRWYVLQAREWARAGYPVMRFSAPEASNSEGDGPSFEDLRHNLAGAIDEFFRRAPSIEEVVLWGFCSQASDALLYAPTDSRVSAVVLVNLYLDAHLNIIPLPGERAAALGHFRRLLKRVSTIVFWRKVLLLRHTIDWVTALRRFERHLFVALGVKMSKSIGQGGSPCLSDRLVEAFSGFQGRILFIFSGRDVEAAIVRNLLAAPPWRRLCSSKTVIVRELSEADHMLSRRAWSDQAGEWTLEWLRSWQ